MVAAAQRDVHRRKSTVNHDVSKEDVPGQKRHPLDL